MVQKKTVENDGYAALQIGFDDVKAQRINKPMKGHFDKSEVGYKRVLKEFRLDDCDALNVGDLLKADTFAVGDIVDVSGTSKGKGFTGAIKQSAQTQGNSRYRPCAQTGRFYGCMLLSVPYLQGQGHGRSHGC